MAPTPFTNALVVFVLQIVLGMTAAWLITLTAGTGAFFLSGLGVSPWMLPLLIAILAATGFAVAVAGLTELAPDLAAEPQHQGAERGAEKDAEPKSPPSLPFVLWPQAIAGLLWAAILGVFVAALPYYGGQFPRFAFFIQAAIFTLVFAGLALVLRRALRQSLR